MILCWYLTHPFPLEWRIQWNICFRIQTTRRWPSGRIQSLVHVHSSTPVPILDSFTLVFFSPVILIYVCRLLKAKLHWEDSNQENPRPLPSWIVIAGTLCTQTSHYNLPLQQNSLILVLLPRGLLVGFSLSSAYADVCVTDAVIQSSTLPFSSPSHYRMSFKI